MSMYTDQYLAVNKTRALTPGTFLAKTLRGRAKDYSSRYLRALENDLRRLAAAGEVELVRSERGSWAYRRVSR
jgi:hypothetical protein